MLVDGVQLPHQGKRKLHHGANVHVLPLRLLEENRQGRRGEDSVRGGDEDSVRGGSEHSVRGGGEDSERRR